MSDSRFVGGTEHEADLTPYLTKESVDNLGSLTLAALETVMLITGSLSVVAPNGE